ncbi:efflux RND transporter periplasmic adaptor subunit [Tatumella saanichensis]|uniref:efflux RND transporter periplasmic adaptor subunit n=1 Tax=Tatumella saanichensis TaxID=480813 RepID=UPI0004B3B96B|nr:efflux RND transporter periplasmic adaptor subunit [Tatumella saanichensis]
MTKNTEKTVRSHWLRWLLVAIFCLIVAGVIWRVWFSSPAGTGMPGPGGRHGRPGAGATTLVHAGVASQANVPVYLTSPGTVIPNASVTVTSRVDGELQKVYFTEGQQVTAGQLLAQIDDRSYQASLAQYEGALQQNKALLTSARLTLARYRKLYAEDSLAKQDLESQMATVGQYSGAVKEDEAQINSAKVNISYSRITAPVSGRVGLRLVDPGNVVSASSTSLVTITQMQPAAVTFSVPQSNIPMLVKKLHHGQAMPATAFDQDGKTVLAQGEVRFISNEIDTSTGSVEMKAMFPNTNEALYANQFVDLRLQTETLNQATVIPAEALQLSSDGSFVFVINTDNTVTRRSVSAGPVYGSDQQVILSGVKPGDKVVTEGIDRLTTGAKVSVVSENETEAASGSDTSKANPQAKQ